MKLLDIIYFSCYVSSITVMDTWSFFTSTFHSLRVAQSVKWCKIPRGHSADTHPWGSVQEIFRQPKNITSASMQPKISAHLILRSPYMNIEYPKRMHIEVRIASNEPRNIISALLQSKNISS